MRAFWFAVTQYMRYFRMGEGHLVAWDLACWHHKCAQDYSNWIELGRDG